jgi:chromosome partitioning protein
MIIAIGGQKGGAGKSTITASLAVALHDRGDDVLLLDCDPQGTLATWHQVGQTNGEALPPLMRMDEQAFRDALPALRDTTRTILVDLDGRNSVGQRVALANADLFILPVRTAGPDIWALGEMIDLVNRAKGSDVNPKLKAYILFNAQQSTVLRRTLMRELHAEKYLPIFDTDLSQLVAYQEAITQGSGPSRTAPAERAAKQVRSLMREIDALLSPVQQPVAVNVTKKRRSS